MSHRFHRLFVAVAALGSVVFGAPAVEAQTPPTPTPVSADAIRDAKVGWARFVTDNFATPTSILDPCPLFGAEDITSQVNAAGLIATDLPFGVSLVRDQVGAGIISIRCGVDLSKSPTPSGATAYAVDVTLLDGQGTYPQYVVRVAGQNTPIESASELGGETSARCRNEPTVCVAMWHSHGVIVTVRLDGPRNDQSEAQTRAVLAAVVPAVMANLAAVTAP